jgi:hypothetical protein
MQAYLQEQAKQRKAAFDQTWAKIAELEAQHEYSKAITQTKLALRLFPRNESLQEELKQLKGKQKNANGKRPGRKNSRDVQQVYVPTIARV